MNEHPFSLKKIARICLAGMGILLAGAIVFYRERMLFADASFIIFSILHSPGLYIQANRYGSFITQGTIYLGKICHLPLKAILIIYSASFNAFYLLTGVALYQMKQYKLTILLCLYYFLFFSQSYFWVSSEVHQAVSWMFLLLGTTVYAGTRRTPFLVLTVLFSALAFITIYTHYVVIIPAVFLWVYLIASRELSFSRMQIAILTTLLIAVIASKNLLNHSSEYDDVHLAGLRHLSPGDILQAFSKKSVLIFYERCLLNYWCAILILILGITYTLKAKKYFLAGWTAACIAGYLAIMGLVYGDDSNILLFHIESEWACMGILVATGFVFECLPRLSFKTGCWLVTGIVVVRLGYMAIAYPIFHTRLEVNEHILARMKQKGISKMALINPQDLMEVNRLYWGIPYETLMMSAIKGERTQTTFLLVNPHDTATQKDIRATRGFYTAFGRMPDGQLNSEYFNVDTTTGYVIMTYDSLKN